MSGDPYRKYRARDERWRYGPLAGYLMATLIFTIVLFWLVIQINDEANEACHRSNMQTAAINRHLTEPKKLPFADCSTPAIRPWPFD